MEELIKDNNIIGLDIGSYNINACICSFDSQGNIHISGVGHSVSEGVSQGKIKDHEKLKTCIKRAIQRAERIARISAKNIIIATNSTYSKTVTQIGEIVIKEEQVSDEDKKLAIKNAAENIDSDNFVITHTLPIEYEIDGNSVTDPKEMFGNKLRVKCNFILNDEQENYHIKKIISDLNLNIIANTSGIYATSKIALTDAELNENTLLIDWGGGTCEVGYFEKHIVKDYFVLPLGGERVTSDLKVILKTTNNDAERIKIINSDLDKDKEYSETNNISITVENDEQSEKEKTNELLIHQIVSARTEEIINTIKSRIKNLKNIDSIVITGGSSNQKGLQKFSSELFGNTVRIGIPREKRDIIESLNYSSCIGAVVYAANNKLINTENIKFNLTQKLKIATRKWFKDFF